MNAVSWRDICTHTFVAELFSVQEVETTQTSAERGMNKMWAMHPTEHYAVWKRKEILSHAATRRNSEDTVSEMSQWQKDKYHLIVLRWGGSRLHGDRGRLVIGRGSGRGKGDCWLGTKLQFCKMARFQRSFHNSVNVLSTAGVHTYRSLRWQILHVFLTLIKISIVFI